MNPQRAAVSGLKPLHSQREPTRIGGARGSQRAGRVAEVALDTINIKEARKWHRGTRAEGSHEHVRHEKQDVGWRATCMPGAPTAVLPPRLTAAVPANEAQQAR